MQRIAFAALLLYRRQLAGAQTWAAAFMQCNADRQAERDRRIALEARVRELEARLRAVEADHAEPAA